MMSMDIIEHDIFSGDEFTDKNAKLPTVTVLNDKTNCGYFIPVNTMAKCGWIDFDEKQIVSHTFNSGKTEQGVLIQNPRMLVCPKTDLYQFDAKASDEQKTKVVVGLYNAELKKDPNIKTERLYLIFFLDETNKPLHTLPLNYVARGVNGATFDLERRAFKAELEACYFLSLSSKEQPSEKPISKKPKNDLFHSLGVFCFTTIAELAGDKQKHWCCKVVAHDKPTIENWKDYFVGYTEVKDHAWLTLEPNEKINVLSIPALGEVDEMMALPPTSELSSAEPSDLEETLTDEGLSPATTVATLATVDHAPSRRTLADASRDVDPDVGF